MPEIEHDFIPTDHFKLLFMNQWNILQNIIFVTFCFVKQITGK